MRPEALREAIAADRARGVTPLAVVATVGTTSTTSVDPVGLIADICAAEGLWLHVDAAYAGVAALVPETRDVLAGCDRADSLVVNPHKWLFTPFDLSAFYCRHMDTVRDAFSLTPDYLQTLEAVEVRNLMDTGVQLGRRVPVAEALGHPAALRIGGHPRSARRAHAAGPAVCGVGRREPGLRAARAGPVQRRLLPGGAPRTAPWPARGMPGQEEAIPAASGAIDAETDALNERLIEAVNATGEVFLSHTRLDGRFTIRLAVGHVRTEERHVRRAWELLDEKLCALR